MMPVTKAIKICLKSLFLLALALSLFACQSTTKEVGKAWPTAQRAQAHINLGMDYLKRGQLDFARTNFEKSLQVSSNIASAFHGLGLVEAQALNMLLARKYLAKAVRLEPNNAVISSDYAVILCKTNSIKQGLSVLNSVQSPLNNNSVGLKLAFGRCYSANNDAIRAEQAYKDVLTINPNIRQALLAMAELKFSTKSYFSARAFLQRYFSTNTLSSDALLLAAKVAQQLNDHAERDGYLSQLHARYPESKQAEQAKQFFSN